MVLDPAIAGIAVYKHPPQKAAAIIAAPAIAIDVHPFLPFVRSWYFIPAPLLAKQVSHVEAI